jgi:mRNA interferase MazF
MVIEQGDVYWVALGEPRGSGPAYRHPYVVLQNNLFNRSRIATVVMCALTSNLKRAESPGNVRLDAGEANLPRASVVNISQVYTVDKNFLRQKIGKLTHKRVLQIVAGIRLLTEPRDLNE